MNNAIGSYGKDVGVLLVGKQQNGKVDIVNAFQGEEAESIYMKLSAIKKVKVSSIYGEMRQE